MHHTQGRVAERVPSCPPLVSPSRPPCPHTSQARNLGLGGGGLPTRDSVPSRPCVRRSGPPGAHAGASRWAWTLGPWKLYPKQVLPGQASRRLSGPGPRQQQQAQGRCPRAWFCTGPGAAREPLRTAQLGKERQPCLPCEPGTSSPVPRDPRTPPPPPTPETWLLVRRRGRRATSSHRSLL